MVMLETSSWWFERTGGFRVGSLRKSNLRKADDILPIAESAEDLQILVDRLVSEGEKYNLLLNASKTKL